MKVCKTKANKLDPSMIERIIQFDKVNMKEILEAEKLPFDESKRRENFVKNDTLIIVEEDAGEIIGYVEYGPSQNEPDSYYIVSIQIAKDYRNSFTVIANLLYHAKNDLELKGFKKLTCNVHSKNTNAIRMYKKLGFEVCSIPGNDNILRAVVESSIIESRFIKFLENRFCNKN